MGHWKLILTFSAIFLFFGYKINNLLKIPPLRKLENEWWGEGDPSKQDTSIKPFKINISNEILDDLKHRLNNAREFTPPLQGVQQQYGMNTILLKEILDFWKNEYDFKKRLIFLNKYPQYTTNIQGLTIHYIHVKPKTTPGIKVLPLLLLHGWPGSVREFYEIIPLLTNPRPGYDFVFEVVVPSLPGYGFSQAAIKPGLGAIEMGVVFKNLMQRLGFEKFYAQAGDLGAIILHYLSMFFPEKVLGYHCNMCQSHTPLAGIKILLGSFYPSWVVKKEHTDRVYPIWENLQDLVLESGYFHIQSTKPDTIGVAINDSPIGLAAYILEKFSTGTNRNYRNRLDGGLKEKFDYSVLLDNVMIYWITGSSTTAFRLYSETINKKFLQGQTLRHPIHIPVACARFEHDFYVPDGIISEIYPNLLHLSDHEGGHFASLEVPHVLAQDVFLAVEKFKKFHRANEIEGKF